jgi:hypothetical protein
MEWITDVTDYLASNKFINLFSETWVQISLLVLVFITVIKRWKWVFLVMLVVTIMAFVIHVAFGGSFTGVAEQAPVFLVGILVAMSIAVYLLYLRE